MRHARLFALLMALLMALLAPAGTVAAPRVSAGAAATQRCSIQAMPLAVRMINTQGATTCARARLVVRAWFQHLKAPGERCLPADGSPRPGVCTVGTWRCRSPHTVNGHTYTVTCTALRHPRRRVRFVNLV